MPNETFFRLPSEKKERVMRAAVGEFVRNGFERAKVEDIASSAGVAKGSMYQYFQDKREIFLYCAQWGLDLIMRKLDQRAHTSGMDVFEYFQETVGKEEVVQEEHELALFMQAIAREPGLADETMRAMYEVADIYVLQLIRNSIEKGVVRKGVDEELLKEYFLGVTDRFKRRWMAKYIDFSSDQSLHHMDDLKRELEQMLDLLKNGMGC